MVRNPVVAGKFYSASPRSLERDLESLIEKGAEKEDALGIVSPHAGYIYSGPVAGSVMGRLKPKSHYVIMGPNHTGMGSPFSIDTSRSWKTPLGEVGLDAELIGEIKKNYGLMKEDARAHLYEHSIEVQLPFLQFLQRDFKFVPIVIAGADLEVYQEIGRQIARAIKGLELEKDTLIVASSDMTHYEPHDVAKRKDNKAIEAILKLDEGELMKRVGELDISMCGYAPTCIMIVAARELGAKKARLVKYQTSGETSGDFSSVVGYAGIVVG